jgi:ubiquinone/menaquinone biosynthesis C-methylase UbiE
VTSARAPRAREQTDRRFFDIWSRFYDFPLVQLATYRPIHEAVLRALEHAQPRSVLDVGCGTGQLVSRLRTALPLARVAGCDFSIGMLRQATARWHDGRWVQCDAQRLPFRSASFDAIVSTEAFHWFPDQAAALREFLRVLRGGGLALIALVNSPSALLGEAVHMASRLVGAPFYWPSATEMRELVEGAGFRDVRQQRVFRVPGGLLLPPVLTRAVRPE